MKKAKDKQKEMFQKMEDNRVKFTKVFIIGSILYAIYKYFDKIQAGGSPTMSAGGRVSDMASLEEIIKNLKF